MKATITKTLVLRCVAVAVSAFVVAGCATPVQPKPAPRAFSAFPAEHQQIYEALLQHMFAHWQHNRFKIPEHFFLSVRGFDAPNDLLARLATQDYRVAPAYEYRDGRGIRCSAGAIRFISPSRVTVYGGYVFGNVGGEDGPFVLIKRNNKWTVISWQVVSCA